MKLRKLFFAAVFAFAGAFCFSQVSVDPSDEFYKYALIWENRGLVSNVPPIRPYPLANVKSKPAAKKTRKLQLKFMSA